MTVNLEKDDRKKLLKNFDVIDYAYLQMIKPSWMNRKELLTEQLNQLSHLYLEGKVVWACVVQANAMLWTEKDPYSCPAEVVYDPTGKASFAELAEVADTLYSLKYTKPKDPILAEYAEHITNELTRIIGKDVPNVITPLPLKISSIFIWRMHLPNGVLQRFLPILISDKTDVTTVLPAVFWHEDIYQDWIDNDFYPKLNMYQGFRIFYENNKKLWYEQEKHLKPSYKEIEQLKSAVHYKPISKKPIDNNSQSSENFVTQSIKEGIEENEELDIMGLIIAIIWIICVLIFIF